jgi:RNA 2',3'-cyclic 3'-phosphodiesterase
VKGAATVGADDRLRIFLALELPEDVQGALRDWGERHLERGRRLESFHVTLVFLGSRPRSELESIVVALRESAAQAGRISLEPVRYRETRSVGMLVLDDAELAATRLAGRLQQRLERLRVYEREKRPWLPHVTVLRIRGVRPGLEPPLPEIGPFAPSGAAAFLSRLRPGGAQYEVLESCPLSTTPGLQGG